VIKVFRVAKEEQAKRERWDHRERQATRASKENHWSLNKERKATPVQKEIQDQMALLVFQA